MHQTQPFNSWRHEKGNVERQACESWCQMVGFLQADWLVANGIVRPSIPVLLSILSPSLCLPLLQRLWLRDPQGPPQRGRPVGVPPKWTCSVSPRLARIFMFNSAETNGILWLSCPHRKTMCLLPNSLKKTNFRIP